MLIDDYRFFKSVSPDHIMFLELGDFYNTFAEDAVLVAQVCGLTLTHLKKIPCAGMPIAAADKYIKQLTEAGHKVALCKRKKQDVQQLPLLRPTLDLSGASAGVRG